MAGSMRRRGRDGVDRLDWLACGRALWRRFGSGFAVLALVGGLLVAPVLASPATPASAAAVCSAEAADEVSAAQMAADCGQRVEVLGARSEYAQVFVEPSGARVLVSTVAPQRVRRADGSWTPISTDLVRQADGSLRPAATLADVTFSGGGLARL